MASAISSTGTDVSQNTYSSLFISTSINKLQSTGDDFLGVEVWCTSGTAQLRFNNDPIDLVTIAATDSVHYFRCTSITNMLEAEGIGAGATVAWRKMG